MDKPQGIRKYGQHRIYYIKCECDRCHEKETLVCYEDHIDKRQFMLGFRECPNCFNITCRDCTQTSELCQNCKNVKLASLTPTEVYRCNLCFQDVKKRLCLPCRYPHLKKK